MKLKLDENIPKQLSHRLGQLGHDVDTVDAEGLTGKDDPAVWAGAQRASRFLVTQDLDFSDIRGYAPGTHAGVLVVRIEDPGRIALSRRIMRLFQNEDVDAWRGCLVVATDRKVRIRRG